MGARSAGDEIAAKAARTPAEKSENKCPFYIKKDP